MGIENVSDKSILMLIPKSGGGNRSSFMSVEIAPER